MTRSSARMHAASSIEARYARKSVRSAMSGTSASPNVSAFVTPWVDTRRTRLTGNAPGLALATRPVEDRQHAIRLHLGSTSDRRPQSFSQTLGRRVGRTASPAAVPRHPIRCSQRKQRRKTLTLAEYAIAQEGNRHETGWIVDEIHPLGGIRHWTSQIEDVKNARPQRLKGPNSLMGSRGRIRE